MTDPKDDTGKSDFKEVVEEVFTRGQWLRKEPGKLYECSRGYTWDPFQVRCRKEQLDMMTEVYNSSCPTKRIPLGLVAFLLTLFTL